jgi:hypothetical protein
MKGRLAHEGWTMDIYQFDKRLRITASRQTAALAVDKILSYLANTQMMTFNLDVFTPTLQRKRKPGEDVLHLADVFFRHGDLAEIAAVSGAVIVTKKEDNSNNVSLCVAIQIYAY